ncbi:MAG: Segregation and condensation protein A [Candidatus Uhrbacteria bacterium GW2011_GWA2_41_10]|nr:MAG: Segregation and condensation protein A [Candidatus Uhrbacteria bacterium GW2011_GWA2_41_10]
MSYEVELEQFSGPLHLLLALIEREELPITDISLAKVANDYLHYLEVSEVSAEELADFLLIAAKLLWIKSNAILPLPDVQDETDPGKLVLQLRLYREFVEAAKELEERYGTAVMFVRPASASAVVLEPVFSIQEKIRDIRQVILDRARLSFKDVVDDASNRTEVVVSFLALLELVKQRIVYAVQDSAFEDITLKRVE